MNELTVDIWSDIACPWCYVGKRRFEAALARFEHRDAVRVRWRAFELDPDAPRSKDAGVLLRRAPGDQVRDVARARRGDDPHDVRRRARRRARASTSSRIRPGNTFDAHRIVHLAAEQGRQDAAKERLFAAYLTEGRAIGERDTLVDLAVEIGLDEGEARELLAGDRFAREVRADEDEARRLGIGGVPCFVLGGRYALSGAQPPAELLRALGAAREEADRTGSPSSPGGESCGPDGCS